jgi:hypothetical protein
VWQRFSGRLTAIAASFSPLQIPGDYRTSARFLPAILFTFAVVSPQVDASGEFPAVLNVKTYASASGNCLLEVDPTDLYGRGPGNYKLTVDGREKWRATLPVTLSDAVVTSDGTAVGYAYNQGAAGFPKVGGYSAGPGNLHVVILDAGGAVRLNQITPRQHSRRLHASPEPLVSGIVLHEDEDIVIIRVPLWAGESWWSYRVFPCKDLRRIAIRSD